MSSTFVVLLLVSAFVAGTFAANDYMWGVIDPATDVLISRETVTKSGFLGKSVTKDYVYAQLSNPTPYTITAIKVTDNKKIKGADATISTGGPGATEVTIKFTSRRGAGIKAVVEIYGKP